jgi:hypothetical protein
VEGKEGGRDSVLILEESSKILATKQEMDKETHDTMLPSGRDYYKDYRFYCRFYCRSYKRLPCDRMDFRVRLRQILSTHLLEITIEYFLKEQ